MRRRCAPLTCVYTCVVETEACPKSSWMARRSAPLSSMCVAYACRNMCGDAGSIPASRLVFYTRRRMSEVSSPRPRRESSRNLPRERPRGTSPADAGEAAVCARQARPSPAPDSGAAGRRLVADRDDPHLSALAVHDELRLRRPRRPPGAERRAPCCADRAPVEQLQDEAVAERERLRPFGGREQRLDLVHAEHARRAGAGEVLAGCAPGPRRARRPR